MPKGFARHHQVVPQREVVGGITTAIYFETQLVGKTGSRHIELLSTKVEKT